MAAVDVQEVRASSYVGFDTITQQIEHKLLKRGFQFNVIVVGRLFSVFIVLSTFFLVLNILNIWLDIRTNWAWKIYAH